MKTTKIDTSRFKKVNMVRMSQARYDELTATDKQASLKKSNTSAPRKSKRKSDEPESRIQEYVENYCEIKGHQLLHIPPAVYWVMGQTNIPDWVKGQIREYLAGVPDCMIFKKEKFSENIDCMDNSVLIMELKTKTGTVGQKQKKWHRGLVVHVPRSSAEAIKLIQAWE